MAMNTDKEMMIKYTRILKDYCDYCLEHGGCDRSDCMFEKGGWCLACQAFDLRRVDSKKEVEEGKNGTLYIDPKDDEKMMLYKYRNILKEYCREVTKDFTDRTKCKKCCFYIPENRCKLNDNPCRWIPRGETNG